MKRSFVVFVCLIMSNLLFAVPPAPGVSSQGMPKDSVKKILTVKEMKALGYSSEQINKVINLNDAKGVKKLAVVFVEFTDVRFAENTSATVGSIQTYVSNVNIAPGTKISTETGLLSNMIKYISECSYNNMTLEVYPFTNSGIGYPLSNTASTYGASQEANVVNGQLFRDAVAAVNTSGATVTNTIYDALMVVHAGIGEESGGVSNDIWSVFVGWASGGSAGGFFEGETVPAMEKSDLSPFGVLCHEFGHQLGLPDLYNTNSGTSNVGKWDLMDYGAWVGSPQGSQPPHMSSWCKTLLKWLTPVSHTNSSTITLNSFKDLTANCVKVPVLGSTTEYFLFEYRQQAGFDIALPGQGVLVWHIDDTKATSTQLSSNIINNGSPLAVALIEKDKGGNAGSSKGESTDPFNAAADMLASPQSDSYSNGPSYITLYEFSGAGTGFMTAKLFSIPATTSLVAKKAINYPNPVKNVLSTTIRVNFSRPFTTATLRIYTIAGEFLFEKALAQTDLNPTVSDAAAEWVYEYKWDLKNSDGANVASGIYLYNIVAEVNSQRESKTGKLAIIR